MHLTGFSSCGFVPGQDYCNICTLVGVAVKGMSAAFMMATTIPTFLDIVPLWINYKCSNLSH